MAVLALSSFLSNLTFASNLRAYCTYLVCLPRARCRICFAPPPLSFRDPFPVYFFFFSTRTTTISHVQELELSFPQLLHSSSPFPGAHKHWGTHQISAPRFLIHRLGLEQPSREKGRATLYPNIPTYYLCRRTVQSSQCTSTSSSFHASCVSLLLGPRQQSFSQEKTRIVPHSMPRPSALPFNNLSTASFRCSSVVVRSPIPVSKPPESILIRLGMS
jgi:hypothetical protein